MSVGFGNQDYDGTKEPFTFRETTLLRFCQTFYPELWLEDKGKLLAGDLFMLNSCSLLLVFNLEMEFELCCEHVLNSLLKGPNCSSWVFLHSNWSVRIASHFWSNSLGSLRNLRNLISDTASDITAMTLMLRPLHSRTAPLMATLYL